MAFTPEQQKVYQREYYQRNKEKILARTKAYHLANREQRVADASVKKAARFRNDPEYRERCRQESRAYYHANKAKRLIASAAHQRSLEGKARLKLNGAIQSGKIKKPDHCSVCKATGKIHGHHPNYNRPLEVIWLCHLCHGEVHREMRQAQKKSSTM